MICNICTLYHNIILLSLGHNVLQLFELTIQVKAPDDKNMNHLFELNGQKNIPLKIRLFQMSTSQPKLLSYAFK